MSVNNFKSPRVSSVISLLTVVRKGLPIPVIIMKTLHSETYVVGYMPPRGQLILLHTCEQSQTSDAPRMYMYNAMPSVLAYCHWLPMPFEYVVHLLVGLIHVIYNYETIWTMRNLHTLLGAQQGFRHELASKYACIAH